MSVRCVVNIKAVPGKGAEFAKAVQERLVSVRTEPGCLQYEMFQSVEDPDAFVLLERWSNDHTFEEHRALNRTRPQMGAGLRINPSTPERYDQ